MKKISQRVGIMLAVVVGVIGTPVAAFAADADPTGGLFNQASSSISGTLIPAAAGVIALGVLFAMGVKWFRKSTKQS